MEAVAPTRCLVPRCLAPTRPADPLHPVAGTRSAEPARWGWAGLEDLRSEVRAAIARHACRRVELDDIVQEALLRAARYRNSLIDPARLRAWVVRIAMNVLRDQMRRDRRLPCVDKADEVFELIEGREEIPGDPCDDDAVEAEGGIFERDVVLRHLDRAYEELPRGDRRVLDAYYARGDAPRRPACVREGVPDLFKVHVFRARGRLARALRKRLALGVHADAASRPSSAGKNHRSARCAPVRPPHVQSGAPCATGNET